MEVVAGLTRAPPLPGLGSLDGLGFLHWNDCAFSLSYAGKAEKTGWLESSVYREQ